ncbi:MAG: putative UDP-4-amino-4-deoxy-L-arabinose--oxoglutarate aminotransferase [Nitrospira sp.]|nr:putative UDP-4-amino-4-deoxy-L-arabinose--oxoglutarate aminotransferase [Nitrospira sp.]
MIPHSRPSLEEEDIRAITETLRSGRIAQGPAVGQFERGMAAYIGVQGAVAVSSGTVALELALRALNIGHGDNVIIPSYVCSAPWLAVQRVGAQARIVDIEPDTYNLDPQRVRKARTSRTRAIIVPHMFGLPADLAALEPLGIPLIEDCAQTLGVTDRGRAVGTVGQLTVCSFYATKLLCTGEGGMVLSNDADLLERVRALREYDQAPSLNAASFNCKMTDLQAAMGLSQLNKLGTFLERRAALAVVYREHLPAELFNVPSVPSGRTHCYYRFVVRVPKGLQSPEELTAYLSRMMHRGVQCRKPVFRPLHRYLELSDFPASDEADGAAISLPIHPSLTEEEIKQVAQIACDELQ